MYIKIFLSLLISKIVSVFTTFPNLVFGILSTILLAAIILDKLKSPRLFNLKVMTSAFLTSALIYSAENKLVMCGILLTCCVGYILIDSLFFRKELKLYKDENGKYLESKLLLLDERLFKNKLLESKGKHSPQALVAQIQKSMPGLGLIVVADNTQAPTQFKFLPTEVLPLNPEDSIAINNWIGHNTVNCKWLYLKSSDSKDFKISENKSVLLVDKEKGLTLQDCLRAQMTIA